MGNLCVSERTCRVERGGGIYFSLNLPCWRMAGRGVLWPINISSLARVQAHKMKGGALYPFSPPPISGMIGMASIAELKSLRGCGNT